MQRIIVNDTACEYDEDHDPLNGRYVNSEHEKLLLAYDKACKENDKEAQQQYADKAHEEVKREAAKDNPLAMFYLGVYYCRARGPEKNMAKAKELLTKALNAGVERAETFLLTDFGDPAEGRILPANFVDLERVEQRHERGNDYMFPDGHDDGESIDELPCDKD